MGAQRGARGRRLQVPHHRIPHHVAGGGRGRADARHPPLGVPGHDGGGDGRAGVHVRRHRGGAGDAGRRVRAVVPQGGLHQGDLGEGQGEAEERLVLPRQRPAPPAHPQGLVLAAQHDAGGRHGHGPGPGQGQPLSLRGRLSLQRPPRAAPWGPSCSILQGHSSLQST